jgi:hypothetical protein
MTVNLFVGRAPEKKTNMRKEISIAQFFSNLELQV